MFTEIFYSMQVQFYRYGTERRKIRRWHIILMSNKSKFGVIQIQPFRFLTVGYKKDMVNPRQELINASKDVLQIIPVPVFRVGFIQRFRISIFIFFFPPFLIVTIDP